MTKALGLAVTCGLVPALYAAGMYLVVSNWGLGGIPPAKAPHLAALIALPLLVAGAVQWWEVWVKPAPKMGAAWDPVPPRDYLTAQFRGHSLFLTIAFVGYMALGFFADRDSSQQRAKVTKFEEHHQKWVTAVEQAEANLESSKKASDKERTAAAKTLNEVRAGQEMAAQALKTVREKTSEYYYWSSLAVGFVLSACASIVTFMVPHMRTNMSGRAITTGAGVGNRR